MEVQNPVGTGASPPIDAQLPLSNGGKSGLNGNIWGQQTSLTSVMALQQALPMPPHWPLESDPYISETQPSMLEREDQHCAIDCLDSLSGDSPAEEYCLEDAIVDDGPVLGVGDEEAAALQESITNEGKNGLKGNSCVQQLSVIRLMASQQGMP